MNSYLVLVSYSESGKVTSDPLGVMEVCDDEKFIHPFEDLKQNIFFGGSKRKQDSFVRTISWLKLSHPDLLL